MLIVLEGCDGAGKSTLAKKLAAMIDATVIHCTASTPNNKEFFEKIVRVSKKKNIIADRFCYGQFVYQEPKDRPLGSLEDLHNLEIKMIKAGAKVIFVTAPNGILERRLASRGETPINNLSTAEIEIKFRELLSKESLMGDSIIEWNTGGVQ